MTERRLPIESFRCPRTGGALSAETDGTWVGPEGDRYLNVSGLRSLVPRDIRSTDAVVALYDSLSSENSSDARSVAYLLPSNFRRTLKTVQRMMGAADGLRILDVGCGHGSMSSSFAKRNHVVGVDLNPTLLRRAAEAGLEVYIADATRLPFRPELFHRVMCINLIQVVTDPPALIRSLDEATRPDGDVLIAFINGECLVRRAFRFLLNLGLFRPRGIPVKTYPRNPFLPQVKAWLSGTALEVLEVGATFAPTAVFRRARDLGPVARMLADTYYVRLHKTRGRS